ncbi:MAG: divergent polysaccharide deacetylase family protein [Alphaproteobacteria bacterium]|nr:divergent polysaccharide deacetylase family protein [Alphaproteobacteria bacterium]
MVTRDYDISKLPPRRETFLARYPRNLKLFVTTVLFALVVLPSAWFYGQRYAPLTSGTTLNNAAYTDLADAMLMASLPHAPALNDQNDRSIRLLPAPDIRVTEDTEEGSLPKISESGAQPWQVYARPYNTADKRPRIAIVVLDLGLSKLITDQAITQLPPVVTLAFNSQGPVVGAWGGRARQDGHEILLQIPVEPFDYPSSDPGPDTLLSNLPNSENMIRLLKALRHATGYIGVTMIYGSRFATDPERFRIILQELKQRGLMLLDTRMVPHGVMTDMALRAGVPVAEATQRLDVNLDPDSIDLAFDGLEKTARQKGFAIGVTTATPLMLHKLQTWMRSLPDRGIALVPLSSVVK